MVFKRIRDSFRSSSDEELGEDYLEIDLEEKEREQKVLVKLYSLNQYDDVTPILNSLREGYTIAVIDIRSLRKKDSIELKRAISKIKKTADALEGSIAGFGENTVIVTPSFAKIHKDAEKTEKKDKRDNLDYY